MDEQLKERLRILEEAKEIDGAIGSAVEEFINAVEEKYKIQIKEDNGAMLVTHLAMALARIKKGEPVDQIDPVVLNELKEREAYRDLPAFFQQLEEKLQIELPESEKGFIALHLCSLLN